MTISARAVVADVRGSARWRRPASTRPSARTLPRWPGCPRRTSRRTRSTSSASSWIDSSRFRAISGTRTFSSKLPCVPADRDRGVVADHLRGDLQHDLRDHRVDLARHDRGALLQLGQEQLADPGARAGAHQRQVVRDLRQRDGQHLERAGQLDQRVAVALRLERILGRGRSSGPVASVSRARTVAANSWWVFSPVPVAVPPSGICATCGSALRTRAGAEPDLRRVAGELLAERDRAQRPSGACGPP